MPDFKSQIQQSNCCFKNRGTLQISIFTEPINQLQPMAITSTPAKHHRNGASLAAGPNKNTCV